MKVEEVNRYLINLYELIYNGRFFDGKDEQGNDVWVELYPGQRLSEFAMCIVNFDEVGLGGKTETKKKPYAVYRLKDVPGAEDAIHALRAIGMSAEHVTCVVFVALDGHKIPAWMICPGQHVPKELTDLASQLGFKLIMGGSSSSITLEILQEHLLPHVTEYRSSLGYTADQPIVIIADGHGTRKNADMLSKLRNANIFVLLLPAHSSHFLQPVDLAPARVLKSIFLTRAQDNVSGSNVGHEARSINPFTVIFEHLDTFERHNQWKIVRNAWMACGFSLLTDSVDLNRIAEDQRGHLPALVRNRLKEAVAFRTWQDQLDYFYSKDIPFDPANATDARKIGGQWATSAVNIRRLSGGEVEPEDVTVIPPDPEEVVDAAGDSMASDILHINTSRVDHRVRAKELLHRRRLDAPELEGSTLALEGLLLRRCRNCHHMASVTPEETLCPECAYPFPRKRIPRSNDSS
jgi:hypothetical protein